LFSGDENMKKTVRNAVLAAMVLTTVCGGAQMAWAADVLSNVKGAGTYLDDTAALGKDAVITATGSQNKNINITGENDTTFSVLAYVGGQITLGDQNTQNVNISTTGTNAYGLMAMHENVVPGGVGKGSHITVYGDTLNINVHGTEYAIGMQAQNNSWSPNKATIDINTKNTVINASTDEDHVDAGGEHTAIGIVAYSGSTVNIKNNLTVNAATSISTRGKSNVIINKDGKGTVKLNGDISFDYDDKTSGTVIDSNLNINLANADSYLNGNIVKHGDAPETKAGVSGMALALSNGATWTSTENSFVNNLTLKNGGTVNLAGDAQTVDVLTKMSSDNGVVATNSLGNKVKVEEKANHIKSLTVKGTGAMADAIAKDSSVAKKLANVVTDASGKSAATNVTTDEGEVAGAYSGTVDANGNLSGSLAKNSTNENISGLGVISLMTWRQENNDLNKRLGELRDSKGQYGLWTRMSRGEAKYNDLGIKNQYNYYQLGYDARISDDWILGGAVSYTDGESSFRDGDGTNKHTGFAVYGSRLADDGSFIDIIAKYAHMKNEYDTYAGAGDGDYSTNGFAFSAEYGKRFKGQNDFWIEPQAELTYGRVDSANFTTAKGVHVHQDSLDSLVGRLGFALGKDVKAGHVYVRASYLYDFKGDVNMYMDKDGAADSYDHDLGGGWWEFGVGTNLNLGHDTHFYFDVERTASGEVSTPWQWNAGIRYSF
jgi:outer membrane autotransporter protein